MLDMVLKVIALATFIAFVAFLPIFVPQVDLIIVCVIVVSMALFDFLIYPALRRRGRS